MKKTGKYLICFAFFFPLAVWGWQSPPAFHKELGNGLELYLSESHDLPLFQAHVFIRGGNVQEPVDQAGLAELTANVVATGGTKNLSPEKMDEWLEERAIKFSASADREWIVFSVTALAGQWEEALNFLTEVLASPRWDPERFQIAAAQAKEEVRRRQDQPEYVAARAFQEAIYGPKHPWGKGAEISSLNRIQISDLKDFYEKNFAANRMMVTVAGDCSRRKILRWFDQWGGSLPKKTLKENLWEILPFAPQAREIKIKRKLSQAFIEVGHLSLQRHAKEQYAYGLLQYILGGEPFTSRLSKDIRTKKGLAYSVYSAWEASPVRGFFKIHVETRKEAKDMVLSMIRENLKALASEGNVTPEELSKAKEALLNKYIFWFASPFDTVVMRARLDLLGYSEDYLEKYPQRMSGVTLKEVQEAARNWIRPDALTTVIVGPSTP